MHSSEYQELSPGLYRVFWADGRGNSLAAIGINSDGQRWLAPINWLSPGTTPGSWNVVDRVEKIDIPVEPAPGYSFNNEIAPSSTTVHIRDPWSVHVNVDDWTELDEPFFLARAGLVDLGDPDYNGCEKQYDLPWPNGNIQLRLSDDMTVVVGDWDGFDEIPTCNDLNECGRCCGRPSVLRNVIVTAWRSLKGLES